MLPLAHFPFNRCIRSSFSLALSCKYSLKIKNTNEKKRNSGGDSIQYDNDDGECVFDDDEILPASFNKSLSLKKLAFLKDPLGKGVDNFNFVHLNDLFELCISHLTNELGRIRTGRTTPAILENISIIHESQSLPLKSIAQVAAKDGFTLQVRLYDESFSKDVIRALSISEPPFTVHPKDSTTLLVPIPKLDESTKTVLAKQTSTIGEKCKMSIRTCRRNALASSDFLSNEEIKRLEKEIQKMHDKFMEKVDKIVVQKKNEIKAA